MDGSSCGWVAGPRYARMTQCLSEADILGYIQGSVNDQQRSAFDKLVSSCPNCQSRVGMARESSHNLRASATHQAPTQVEATSALEVLPSRGSHWTDGDVVSQ